MYSLIEAEQRLEKAHNNLLRTIEKKERSGKHTYIQTKRAKKLAKLAHTTLLHVRHELDEKT